MVVHPVLHLHDTLLSADLTCLHATASSLHDLLIWCCHRCTPALCIMALTMHNQQSMVTGAAYLVCAWQEADGG